MSALGGMMGAMPADRAISSPLMGRSDELASLRAWVGLDEQSPVRAVLLGGDAGVGKTRLLSELRESAEASGWRVLLGHCLDLADSALPYLPFSELLGRLLTDHPELEGPLGAEHPAAAALVPGRRLLSQPVSRDDLSRGELFDAVHGVLELAAVDQPVLVVIEDAHWADHSTRDLVNFLLARPFRGRVALLISYRTDDLHRRHPLRAAVAEWARVPGVQRLAVGPLPDADVRLLVRALHAGDPAEREVAGIVARAEGNAFFAEELVGASEVRGQGLPDDLADLLLVRIDRLDDVSRSVVRAASAAGRRVSHALLEAVAGLDTSALDAALRGALENHVLVPAGDDGYAFRHALLGEAVYDDLLPGERVRLHAAYVDALTSGRVDGTAAEVARHARAAHDVGRALTASITAGREAMAVGGPEEAARHFENALSLVGSGAGSDGASGDDVDVIGLVHSAAEAIVATGQPSRALAVVEDHARNLPPDASDEDRARLLIAVATVSLVIDPGEESLPASEEALRLAGDDPTVLRAQALSVRARALATHGRDEEAAPYAAEAIALARQLDLSRVVAESTTTLAGIDDRTGQVDVARATFERVIAEARAARDPVTEIRSLYLLGELHYERAELTAARAAYTDAMRVAARAGRPYAPYAIDARLMNALAAFIGGAWDDVLSLTDVSGESPPKDAEALLDSVRLLVLTHRGEAVVGQAERLRQVWRREGVAAVNSAIAAIELHGEAGRAAEALVVYDDLVDVLSEIWHPRFQARVRLLAHLVGALGSAAVSASQADRARLVERLDEFAAAVDEVIATVRTRGREFGPEGQAWVARHHAETLRLRWLADRDAPALEELVAAWGASAEAFETYGHVFETARSRARLAAVLRAAGDPRAEALLDAAREVARSLGARPLVAEIGTQPPRRTPSASALTAREAEILGLVADGRTNGEIARVLFISTKTVSVHVSNILAKLGAAGRTEAAAIARRNGLLD